MAVFITGAGTPPSYTLLDFIQSSGTQYIRTGITFNASEKNSYRMTIDAEFYDVSLGLVGCASYLSYYVGSMNGLIYYSTSYSDSNTGLTYSVGTRLQFDLDNPSNSIKIISNGTQIYSAMTTTSSQASGAKELYLFGYNANDAGAPMLSAMRIYSAKIYKNGTMLRDFIPCINPQGELGMFDSVSRTFFGNAGSGSFTGG